MLRTKIFIIINVVYIAVYDIVDILDIAGDRYTILTAISIIYFLFRTQLLRNRRYRID